MFKEKSHDKDYGFRRISINDVERDMLCAALDLLGVLDMDLHLNKQMSDEDKIIFLKVKARLQRKINK